MLIFENKEKNKSMVVDGNKIYYYDVCIPENLVKELKVTKGNILLNHTESVKVEKLRGRYTNNSLKKKFDKFCKE